ncbi:FKBP-type peptidyl-prolyl cis-trans isomerase [Mucilaginibacter sp. HMF5004]|uniref:FKBP-type peptidyl-prolyl cis-trans isomerase n=1 Tax=Mucilaginibacter rivuli TaxID=2857527 RepID=UPI001C5F4AE7|nr:FKBP-type peptidyl-prolyl cis-trans isomerase [Mucilaginibacter rivuli]MBW4888936.1 FKBP-type peptidyl-prolyl cis-trans isomerase [Mucilaginibacter rivuli]
MKITTICIAVLLITALISCKKSNNEQTIEQFDEDAIQDYIKQNGLTAMKKDTSGGDTAGVYYQILTPGTGKVMDYPDKINYTYQFAAFDGSYVTTDTIANHANTYVGYLSPKGLEHGIKNILRRKGGRIRMLIPSHLAYGTNGVSSGTTRLNGNQCLDYIVSVVDNQASYDDISIKNYIKTYNLSGFTKTASGLYYKVTKAGTGTSAVTINSVVGVQYTGYLFNQTVFDSANTSDGTAGLTTSMYNVIAGWQEGLPKITTGGKIILLIPSGRAYGDSANSGIPAFSCLRFDINLISITN